MLPESSQTSALNMAFASDYLDIKDVREFGALIKEYFKFSPAFYAMYSNHTNVDPELKRHCEAVKYQKCSMKDLAEFYISYMDRMGKEADPKVKDKLKQNKYDDNIIPMNPMMNQYAGGFGGQPGMNPNPGFPGGQMPPQPYGQPPNNPFGGQSPGGFGNIPPGGHNFGGAPPTNPFGAGGFNYGGAPPGPGGYQGGFGGYGGAGAGGAGGTFQMNSGAPPQPYNPFAAAQQQQYAKPPQPYQGQPPQSNPFATPPQPGAGGYNNNPFGSPTADNGQGKNNFDDIFADPKDKKNAGFGGDKKPSEADSTDDFLKQLEDLKKL